MRLSEVNLRLPHQPFSRPVNYRPLALKVNNDAATARVVMVFPSIYLTLPEGRDNVLGLPGVITICRHGYSYSEIAPFSAYVYPYIPETGEAAYTRVLNRLTHLYKEDHDREELLEKEVEDFSFGDEGLVDDNKRNRIPLHRQDFYRLIRELGLYKEIGSGKQWVDDWAEGKPNTDLLYQRHISTFIRNGGEVGYENNKFYVAYSQ